MIALSLMTVLSVTPFSDDIRAERPNFWASSLDATAPLTAIETGRSYEIPIVAAVTDAAPVINATADTMTAPEPGEGDEIVVTASRHRASDPLRSVNAASFELTEQVDSAVVAPVALAYKQVAPKPIRSGLRNFFSNLREPVNFANFLLQHKIGKAAETVGRFALNSTLGLAGVIDVAKRCPFNLPRRTNGFAETLGFYGVKPGPFLFIPLVGPTTLRDLVGGAVDGVASPVAIGGPFRDRAYIIASNIFRTVDRRAEMDEELTELRQQPDPYVARRDRYIDRRADRLKRLKGLADADVAETPYGQIEPAATNRSCQHWKKADR